MFFFGNKKQFFKLHGFQVHVHESVLIKEEHHINKTTKINEYLSLSVSVLYVCTQTTELNP